jgi:hypothetical protein
MAGQTVDLEEEERELADKMRVSGGERSVSPATAGLARARGSIWVVGCWNCFICTHLLLAGTGRGPPPAGLCGLPCLRNNGSSRSSNKFTLYLLATSSAKSSGM